MTAVGASFSSVASRVAEQLHKAVVIADNQVVAIGGFSDAVDVGTVGAAWEDGFVAPGEVDRSGSPLSTSGVASAIGVLSALR